MRRVMSELGASGLSVAMGLFGRSTPAQALYHEGCCNLIYPPSNYTNCYNRNTYVWGCCMDQPCFLHCSCVEGNGCSAYECHYN